MAYHNEGNSTDQNHRRMNSDDDEEEEVKNRNSQTSREYIAHKAVPGIPFDVSNIDSPNSQTHMNGKKRTDTKDLLDGVNLEKVLNGHNKSKEDIEWGKKPQKEEEKHDEERSLLDPDNEDGIYSKDSLAVKNGMRRVSTKPEKPLEKSPSVSKLSEEDDTEEVIAPKKQSE